MPLLFRGLDPMGVGRSIPKNDASSWLSLGPALPKPHRWARAHKIRYVIELIIANFKT
jgi:hypothetical protein